MENQCSPLLSWTYFGHGKTMEELRTSLLCTTRELLSTKLVAQEELKKRNDQLVLLEGLLNRIIRERDEAREECQKLLHLQQQQQQKLTLAAAQPPMSGVSGIEDDPRRGIESAANNGFSSSDCEESIVSSPVTAASELDSVLADKPLPEKGKLLQAVMKAGPLLQTLLLAGPLPEWRHPPPPLEGFEIPPVSISPPPLTPSLLLTDSLMASFGRKRGMSDGSHSPIEAKLQRVTSPN
ncbi:hypothetical protein SAY86_025626 [Trapa natans]|uniref:Uncharacterized protein n=1 Tax=Trapa natans TaxID=22666 RepID=A0AAN7QDM6_TRANT|nr:hypothetical protein SAY86_025626 [Trapa natans]